MRRTLVALSIAMLAAALAGCLGSSDDADSVGGASAPDTAGRAPGLEPATSKYPAAGICLKPPRSMRIVSAHLNRDTTQPRCLQVHADQRLRLVNSTNTYGQPGRAVTIRLGPHRAVLDPGEAVTFREPFGAYLAPGAHSVENGPAIWLLRD